jgi:hypothetical protein
MPLPFVTKPKAFTLVKIGNPEIGELEIPKLGDLSVNEKLFIKECLKGLPDLQQLAAGLAQKIAKETGKKLVDVYNALTSGDTEFLGEHLGEALEFNKQFTDYTEVRRSAVATAILRRIAPEWTIEKTGDPLEVPPELLNAIAEFGYNEELGWPETKEPEQITEELVGKSQEASTEPKSRTGKKSSGNASDTGLLTPVSQPNILEVSQSA